MDYINSSNDRVVIHQAMKHLIVAGNSLIFMGKDGLKNFHLIAMFLTVMAMAMSLRL